MFEMSNQYVFELKFKGGSGPRRENKFVIIQSEAMEDFTNLITELAKNTHEPFRVQYIDDEDDIISIDTVEEFREFVKLAVSRSIKGMMMKLILNSEPPPDFHMNGGGAFWHIPPHKSGTSPMKDLMEYYAKLHFYEQRNPRDKVFHEASEPDWSVSPNRPSRNQLDENVANPEHTCYNIGKQIEQKFDKMKKAILSELRGEIGAAGPAKKNTDKVCVKTATDEDSDENAVHLPEKRKVRLHINLKRLEKKEKSADAKFDQRMEKLESKKRKLLEKASYRTGILRKPHLDPQLNLPQIMSAIATQESSSMTKRVAVEKVFKHVWHIINDGTCAWPKDVELRHTWSTPGLEPEELSVACIPLPAGEEAQISIKFKAPKIVMAFVSYWHFFYRVDSEWQQFGHYVFLSGSTKMPKQLGATPKLPDDTKKPQKESRNVTFFKGSASTSAWPESEAKILNQESYKVVRKALKASLASSQIAAEMAREAANAAIRSRKGKTLDSSVVNVAEYFSEMTDAVNGLNLADSGSDNDANGETDPGFVIVEYEKEFNVQANENEMNPTKGQKVENSTASVPEATNEEEGDSKRDRDVSTLVEEESKPDEVKQLEKSTNALFNEEMAEARPTMSFPRLDHNVNYPVFPPSAGVGVYQPHPYPVYTTPASSRPMVFPHPPPNASSHPIVFPPPPPLPVHFREIPIPTFPALPPPPQPINPAIAPQQMMFPLNPTVPVFGYKHPIQAHRDTITTSASNTAFFCTTPKVATPVSTHTVNLPLIETNNGMEEVSSTVVIPAALSNEGESVNIPQPADKKNESGGQILPQSLVNGAINVAASAYSRAWNALNNLRLKEGEAMEFDPVFENNMSLLIEMGFNNIERNARLLKRFNNDVSQVIGFICSAAGEGDNLNID